MGKVSPKNTPPPPHKLTTGYTPLVILNDEWSFVSLQ